MCRTHETSIISGLFRTNAERRNGSDIATVCLVVAAVSIMAHGCATGETEVHSFDEFATAIVLAGESHDVDSVLFKILPHDGACDDPALMESTSPIEFEQANHSVLPGGSGNHAFADGLFILEPGEYRVCAFPLQEDGSLSEECSAASALAVVAESVVEDLLLVSQCRGIAEGGLDNAVIFNDPPVIEDLVISPSKFLVPCERASIDVTASDLNGDALSYEWEQLSGPESTFTPDGASAMFSTLAAGDYLFRVVVTDVHLATTSLTYPIYVSEGIDSPTEVTWRNRHLSYEGVSLNEQGNCLSVAPGEEVTMTFHWNIDVDAGSIHCPGCIIQFYYGLSDIFSTCFGMEIWGPGRTGSGDESTTFVAPDEPGIYFINHRRTLQYSCQDLHHDAASPVNAVAYLVVQ